MKASAGADIDIALDLAEDRVVGVNIVPRRLPPIGALVAGRPVAEMLKLVPLLFTLCAAAHGVAAQTVVDAARGIDVGPEVRRRRAAAVLSERLVEQLRGVVTGFGLLERPSVAAAMRELIRASATFAAAANAGVPERLSAIDLIELALGQIGIAGLDPMDHSASVRFSPSGTGCLSAGNDLEIIARLAREGARYAAAPDLNGAVPETGPWARLHAGAATNARPVDRTESAAARLRARLDEIVRTPRMLCGLTVGDDDPSLADATGYCLGEGRGAAAVETARGRLYHHLELDADGRVSRFQCLAPTEWNFHPRGPLARMLRGATVRFDRGGRDAVAQLVAAFDPCVGYRVTVREVADA
jgi:coenzyme F420-reducing hydrogenase alpha subunit